MSRADFLDCACLRYDGRVDHPSVRAKAAALLQDDPPWADDLYVAAALGRADDLRRLATTTNANAASGPRHWPPLLYLCYSRVADPNADYLAAAKILLDLGADPNAHFVTFDVCRFTTVAGAMGRGERGPRALPEHPDGLKLARLLLEAGADPNDSQALYNRMLRPGAEALALLLEFGLGPDAPLNWLSEFDGRVQNTTLHYQMMNAASNGHLDRIELLLAAGVDPHTRDDSGNSAWRRARLGGHNAVVRHLEEAGVSPEAIDALDALQAALLAGEDPEARRIETPAMLEQLRSERPDLLVRVAGEGRIAAVRLLLERGYPINEGNPPPLHNALWHGHVDIAQELLDRGADPAIQEPRFNSDAQGWAEHGGHQAAIQLMESREAL
ncbi:MAG: ankyrin repeat domain-containing protein [Myxococcota bacterium]